MDKRLFHVYLAKECIPNNEAYAKLNLPASPWELWDALDKVRLNEGEQLYMEIEDYYAFAYLAPHLDGVDISLNELNDLAAQLAALDEVQGIAFEGMFSIEVQRKVNTNGGVITLQDLRDLAVSAKTDCYHVVDAADDAQLGRFYAENGFIPELDGISDEVFEMLDFAGIGRMMRCGENGVFVGSLYVLQDGELTTAPPCPKELPEKPEYLFRLTLGLHPDIGDERTVTLELPASEKELEDAQERLGTLQWENTVVLDYDGIIPNAAIFADLPMEIEAFNEFAKSVKDNLLLRSISKIKRQINPRLKIDGILLTMVDNRTNNAKAIISSLRSTVGENIRVFRSEIPFSVRAAECSLSGESIFSHDRNGKVAAAYEALTKEVTELEERAKNRSGPDRVR